jgi:hypothetical protein
LRYHTLVYPLFFVIGNLFNTLRFGVQASQLASRLLPVSPQTAAGFAKKILFLNAELSLALRQPELALRHAAPLESLIEGRAPPFVLASDFAAVSFFHCCGSAMFIPDPRSEFFHPGSRVQKDSGSRNSDPEKSHQHVFRFKTQDTVAYLSFIYILCKSA